MKLLILFALISCISCTSAQQYNRLHLETLPEKFQNFINVVARIRAVLRIVAEMLCAACNKYKSETEKKSCIDKYCASSKTKIRINTDNVKNQLQDLIKYIAKSETPDLNTEIKALETVRCTICLEQKGANTENDCVKEGECTIADSNNIQNNTINITTASSTRTPSTSTSTIKPVKLTNSTSSPRKQTVRGHRGGSSRNGRRQQNRATSRRKEVDKRQCSSCDQLKEHKVQRSCREKLC